jgi:hypothetical protein
VFSFFVVIALEIPMDTPDALDITSDISSDSEFVASDYSPTASPDPSNHGSSSSEDEWLLDDRPGQASGIMIASPNHLDVSLEVLGDTVRNGQRVTRYFIRIEESNDDENEREE